MRKWQELLLSLVTGKMCFYDKLKTIRITLQFYKMFVVILALECISFSLKIYIFLYLFRSSGDTLSRENFYKLKTRLAETRMLASGMARPEDSYPQGDDQAFKVIMRSTKSSVLNI